MSKSRIWLAGALAALLAAGGWLQAHRPIIARPALWEISGPAGQKGWLLGTIHALPRPARWHDKALDGALAASDRLVVEIADLNNDAATAAAFGALAHSPDLPPLDQRLAPAQRPALARALARIGRSPTDFTDTETWAAALMLANGGHDAGEAANGIDRALLRENRKPVVELEGARGQLSVFDRLPEADQRSLLAAVLAGDNDDESEAMAEAWARGDMATITAETRKGLLAVPALRAALYTGRNRDWATRIDALLRGGAHPFVAVGAGHMAGGDGLPALLAAHGWRVRRLQ